MNAFIAASAVAAASITVSATSQQPTPAPTPTSTISTGTRLVVLDVVVLDKSGVPVHGLKPTDFVVTENKATQSIKNFEPHTSTDATQIKLPPPLKLPPGTFTDYTPVPEGGPLNVLLLDTLNTAVTDQAYVRNQLEQYVKHVDSPKHIAIFGLTSRLLMLQGFTSDPETLRNVVEHKISYKSSPLLDDPTGTKLVQQSISASMEDAGNVPASVIANAKQFEAQTAAFQSELRIRYTLDAFNQLARYLAQFPGRKNLIWFSGSFPVTVFADTSLNDPFVSQVDASDELRQTTNLLDKARVAVYPIDARGLQTLPVFDASRSGRGTARNPSAFNKQISDFYNATAQEHMTMAQIADDTGGHAFYNTNDLAKAVHQAIESGANYYTLAYSPTDRTADGKYRRIRLQLQGTLAGQGLNMSYRRGYYADTAPDDSHGKASSLAPAANTDLATNADGTSPARSVLLRTAMQRGAPTPSELLFKARILPDVMTTTDIIAPRNITDPKLKGPFRVYDIDVAAVTSMLSLKLEPDGRRHGAVELVTYVYDPDGKLLVATGDTITMNLEPAVYAQLLKTGLSFRQQVSTPAKGESFFRVAIHDLVSNRMGAIEVPRSAVAGLEPAPRMAVPPPPAAATPAPAPPH